MFYTLHFVEAIEIKSINQSIISLAMRIVDNNKLSHIWHTSNLLYSIPFSFWKHLTASLNTPHLEIRMLFMVDSMLISDFRFFMTSLVEVYLVMSSSDSRLPNTCSTIVAIAWLCSCFMFVGMIMLLIMSWNILFLILQHLSCIPQSGTSRLH